MTDRGLDVCDVLAGAVATHERARGDAGKLGIALAAQHDRGSGRPRNDDRERIAAIVDRPTGTEVPARSTAERLTDNAAFATDEAGHQHRAAVARPSPREAPGAGRRN